MAHEFVRFIGQGPRAQPVASSSAGLAAAIVLLWLGSVGPAAAQNVAPQAVEPSPLYGVAYSQFRNGHSPDLGRHPTRAEIAEDLEHLRRLTDGIRLYGLTRSGRVVVEEASKLGFRILLGIWLSHDRVSNEREIAAAIELSRLNLPGIEALIVGSEVLLRRDLDPEELASIIRRVRLATERPVAYAEIASIWRDGGPEIDRIADEVQLILSHVYPFWDSVSIEGAPAHYERTLEEVKRRFPAKSHAVGETGWPVAGPARGDAVPSPSNQATWVRYILARSHQDQVYYFSAFSEPWKDEGGVGAHWGIFTPQGELRSEIAAVLAERGLRSEDFGFSRSDGSPDHGDTPLALWDVFNRRDHEGVEVVADRIITRDSADARLQEEAEERGPQLDGVALAFFLLGQSKEMRGEVDAAREAYRIVLERYTRAMAWDPRGWWWSIAQAARERLRAMRVATSHVARPLAAHV